MRVNAETQAGLTRHHNSRLEARRRREKRLNVTLVKKTKRLAERGLTHAHFTAFKKLRWLVHLFSPELSFLCLLKDTFFTIHVQSYDIIM